MLMLIASRGGAESENKDAPSNLPEIGASGPRKESRENQEFR